MRTLDGSPYEISLQKKKKKTKPNKILPNPTQACIR